MIGDWTVIIAYRDGDLGRLEVEVHPDELVGRYVVRDGSTRDMFVLRNTTPGVAPTDPPLDSGRHGAPDASTCPR